MDATPLPMPDAQTVIAALCEQQGTWSGTIAVTDSAGRERRIELVSTHSCSGDGRWQLTTETFRVPAGAPDSTAKVTYAAPAKPSELVTAYFARGAEVQHRYRAVAVVRRDATHWSTTIESADAGDRFEDRPASMRYVRARDGDRLESRKEVRFTDGGTGSEAYTARSVIVQMLVR
jgi:hypothetical protein